MTKLYVVPGSHPCATVMKALELKGMPYKRVDLVPAFHKLFQKAKFGGATVPGIVFDDGTKLLGSRAIVRELERRAPEPALFPCDEEAEAWGDEVLQPAVRRLIWWGLTTRPGAQLSVLDDDTKLFPPTPRAAARLTARPLAWMERRFNDVTAEAVAADIEAFPGHLDRIDALDRRRDAGGRESRRPADRGEHPPGADPRRPQAADRPTARGRVRTAAVPALPRPHPGGGAAYAGSRSGGPAGLTPLPSSAASASAARPCPGTTRSGSSSSRGTSTKRRPVVWACGRVRRSDS